MPAEWAIATSPPSLLPGEAHVWAVPLAKKNEALHSEAWTTLTGEERVQADAFRVPDARLRFLVARGVLRILLGQYLNQPPQKIQFGVGTKPRLAAKDASKDLRFNVSHSGEMALIAVTSDCEVGVDVEQIRAVKQLEEISRRYFHPLEIAEVLKTKAKSRTTAFFRCWTGKEAILKAVGVGITASLDAFQVPLDDSFEGWIDLARVRTMGGDSVPSQCWLERLAPGKGYTGAVSFVESHRSVRCFSFANRLDE